MIEKIICPNCNKETFYCLDEWGRTPFHLHCDKCYINIGATSIRECKELFKDFHEPCTQMEYYNKRIQYLAIKGEELINAE